MFDIPWELEGVDDENAPHGDIRLRGPLALKELIERIARRQTQVLKVQLKRRRGMSANRLWLSIAQAFAVAYVAKFGPLPDEKDELACRQYDERVAAVMRAEMAKRKR